jgi:UTP:GlnB (protein PII) uridylyltransferase
MIDVIRGVARDEPTGDENRAFSGQRKDPHATAAHKVVVTSEHDFVVIGVDARDRPGLLLDVSKGLSRLNLNLRHTEASVVGSRSISIWRCELVDAELPDPEEIWSVLNVSEYKDLNLVYVSIDLLVSH